MNTTNYWAEHIIHPVEFDKDLELILEEENTVCIEVGAGRSLCTFALQHKDRKEGQTFLNILRHPVEKENDLEYVYAKLGLVWCAGIELDWKKFMGDKVRNRISTSGLSFREKTISD